MDQARNDSLETCHRRRTDPGLEAVSSTAPMSKTTRNVSNEDQTTTGQSRIATSSGQRVSGTSGTQSTSNPQREVPEATESSENEATATTVSPKSVADTSLSHVPIIRSRNTDFYRRVASSTSASSSTQQQRARRPSSKHKSREISDLFQPSAASANVRPRGQLSGSRRNGEGSECQAPSSSQVYRSMTEQRRLRRRSSRSSERRRM